jgi:hypothetical protein
MEYDGRLQEFIDDGTMTEEQAAAMTEAGLVDTFVASQGNALFDETTGDQSRPAESVGDFVDLFEDVETREQNRELTALIGRLGPNERSFVLEVLGTVKDGETEFSPKVVDQINAVTGIRMDITGVGPDAVHNEDLFGQVERLIDGLAQGGFAPTNFGESRLSPNPKDFNPTQDFKSENPETFLQFKSFLMSEVGLPESLADKYASQEGNRTGYSDLSAFLLDKEVLGGAERLMTGSAFLPSNFRDEFGSYYVNTDISGPVPVPWNPVKSKVPQAQLDKIDDPFERAFLEGTGRFEGRGQSQVTAVPTIPRHEVKSFLSNYRPQGRGSGGGGIRFDRAAIRESIRQDWRNLLLEEPPNVESLVDSYIASSRAAGMGLSVRAWTTGQIEGSARGKMLYRFKPEGMGMGDYMGGFRSVAQGFGLQDEVGAIESGAMNGASAAGFARRLQGSREVQTNQRGKLSQRFANTFQGMGALKNT